jgi:hypothetical protein
MKVYEQSAAERDALAESLAAELTGAVYRIALCHGTRAAWVDLELDLWRALTEAIKKWESTSRTPHDDGPAYIVGQGRLSADCSHFVVGG